MTYTPRLPPRQHQLEAARRYDLRPAPWPVFAWLMDRGTGKSKVILDQWGEAVDSGSIDDLLIIAPAGSYHNWFSGDEGNPSEVDKHIDPVLRARTLVLHWKSGASQTQRRALREALIFPNKYTPRVFCVNVEALSSATTGARQACLEFMRGRRVKVAVDESTRIRGNTKRTRAVQALGQHAAERRIATGLVTPRDPLDLYNQFFFLDWRILGFRSYWGFRAHHAVMRKITVSGRDIDVVVGFRNVEELSRKIDPWSYRVLKEDCLDLPPKQYLRPRHVPLSDEQRRMYRELRQFATSQIEGENFVTATNVLAQIVRFQQLLCGLVTDEDGGTHWVPEHRTAALIEVLDEHSGKAIIWVPFDPVLRRLAADLAKEYGERAVACFWGGNVATRLEDERRFKTDPQCRFMISTPQAGGVGNTWVVADLVVYYANTWDLEHRFQSEDRAHRDGQELHVNYLDLVAPGTVDERIIHALRHKIDLNSTITGENFREWLV